MSNEINLLIQSHIESFHPAVPHYRRAHTPLRRYLILKTVIQMWGAKTELIRRVTQNERCVCKIRRGMCHKFSLHLHKLLSNENEMCERENLPSYNPPTDLISQVDSWAETLLTDSKIFLKDDCDVCNRWKLHATQANISQEE